MMVYLFGFLGFALGFAVGLGVINVLLRNRTVSEVKKDRSARTVYGLFVWLCAVVGVFLGLWAHSMFF